MGPQNLSVNLFNSIIDFLPLNDTISLSLTCRKLYKLMQSDIRLFLVEYMKTFFPKELNYFYEHFEDLAFQNKFLKQTPQRLFKMAQNPFWKKTLIEKIQIRKEWKNLLIRGNDSVYSDFLETVENALQNPNVPFFLLIRENYGRNCKTTIQRKIIENVVYNKTCKFDSLYDDDKNEAIFEYLSEGSPLAQRSAELIQARWYFLIGDSKIKDFHFSHDLLLQTYSTLTKTIENFATSVFEYLESINDPFYLLQEYSAFWTRYSNSIFEMEDLFKSFTKALNERYELEFADLPNFPKFSLMRLMIKIWLKSVWEQIKEKIIEAFGVALQELRFISLKNYRDISENKLRNLFEDPTGYNDNFYKGNSSALGNLIGSFVDHVTDISINELSIHHLGHSKMIFSSPFNEIEEKIKACSEKHLQSMGENFKENLVKFDELLCNDIQLLKPILNPKIIRWLKIMKYQTIIKTFKKNLLSEVSKSRENPHETPKKILKTDKKNMMTVILDQIFNTKQKGNFSSSFLCQLYLNLKRTCGKNFMATYLQNRAKMDSALNKKSNKDEEIEEFLEWKNIGAIPTDIIEFFDFSKNTNFKSLDGFRRRFVQRGKESAEFIR